MGKIPEVTDRNERDFLDGVLEVYDEIFTKRVEYYPLDETASNFNSYGESTDKKYKEPIELTARVKIEPINGDRAINRVSNRAFIRVPTQNMWDNGLAVEADDLAEMNKGKFSWNNIDYQVIRVQPRTMINDSFIIHEFVCEEIILDTELNRTGW